MPYALYILTKLSVRIVYVQYVPEVPFAFFFQILHKFTNNSIITDWNTKRSKKRGAWHYSTLLNKNLLFSCHSREMTDQILLS